MIRIAHAQLWVHDQDEALAFYTDKVGLEVRDDNTERRRGYDFRWVTVGAPGQDDVAIALLAIQSPPWSRESAARMRAMVVDGLAPIVQLITDDCRSTYRKLNARGVEFTEKPQRRAWGIDAAFRDPFGNQVRIVQLPA